MAGAVPAFIIGEVDESERSVRKTPEQHLLLFSSQDKTFFQWQAFSFRSALPKHVSSSADKSRNAPAGALTKQLERECKKEVIMAALWS